MVIFPEIILLILAVLLILVDAFSRVSDSSLIGKLALAGVIAAFAATFTFGDTSELYWGGLYALDPLSLFFKRFFLVTVFLVLAMSFSMSRRMSIGAAEAFILPLFSAIGMMLLASAVDFMTLFVSLELITISFYVLVALKRQNLLSLEAGTKYLIIGALSTGFLIYGIALVFGITGSTSLSGLATHLGVHGGPGFPLLLAMVLILAGFGFKLASVPFHIWAPDVYQGAPTPVTAFLSVGSKAAGVIVLLRVFFFSGFSHESIIPFAASTIALMAGLSVLLGNFAALTQRNLKRLLGYSSIGHAGFILMGLSCVTPDFYYTERGVQAVLVYLSIYLVSALLAFFIIAQYEDEIGGVDFRDFNGLAQRSPLLAFGMLISFVSLAGVPPLAGFVGKLGIFAAVWEAGNYGLLIIAIIAAVAGLYYYLGVVRAMYWNAPSGNTAPVAVDGGSKLVIAALCLILLVLGFWQLPLQSLIAPIFSDQTIILSAR